MMHEFQMTHGTMYTSENSVNFNKGNDSGFRVAVTRVTIPIPLEHAGIFLGISKYLYTEFCFTEIDFEFTTSSFVGYYIQTGT